MPLFTLVFLLMWPAPAERREAVEPMRSDEAYQTRLPVADAGPPEGADAGAATEARPRRGSETREGIVGVLMWLVMGLCVLGLAAVAVREYATRPARAKAPADPVAAPAVVVAVEAETLDEAERLARAGRYAEAIHVLLLRTFRAIGREAALPVSYTSREILARVPMQDAARGALRHLVFAVEVSLFGDQEPGALDYARCKESFEQVLAAEGVRVT